MCVNNPKKEKNPHKWKHIASGMYWTEYKCMYCGEEWVEQWEDIRHFPEGGLTPFFGCIEHDSKPIAVNEEP